MSTGKDNAQEIQKFQRIVELVSQDAKSGLKAFYDEYGAFIYAIANTFRKSNVTPDEIFQEILIAFYRWVKKLKALEEEKRKEKLNKIIKPKGWFYRATINQARTLLRKSFWKRFVSLSEHIKDPNDEIETLLATQKFYYLIKNLSEQERHVLTQRFVLQKKFEEISSTMDKPLGTVTAVYYRAIDKLRAEGNKNPEKFL